MIMSMGIDTNGIDPKLAALWSEYANAVPCEDFGMLTAFDTRELRGVASAKTVRPRRKKG